jgi:ribosomal protein S12 methylthiotransferase accessory factor
MNLFDMVDYLVDEKVGVIHSVHELPREAGAPKFFHFYAEACNTSAFCNQKNFSSTGGASAERGLAMAKAIGEAVERYCSAIYDASEFTLSSFEGANVQSVAPDQFALYNQEQYALPAFPYVPFTNATPIRWVPTIDLRTKETWHVPAAMVFMPYSFDEPLGEGPITQRISTGLACHSSFGAAAVSAMCEVIERDAFTITWQARLSRAQIRLTTLSERNRELVARFERTGSSVTLLDLTMDHGIPTILGVLRGQTFDAPALVFAASADPDPEEAVRKSLEELAHTRRLSQELTVRRSPFVPVAGYENVGSQDDHVHFYCDYDRVALAEFIFSSEKYIDFSDIENLSTGNAEKDLQMIVKKINVVGHKALLADLTTPDVAELGLTVVRALIPGFHPLFIGHRFRAKGGSRLWEVPQKLGFPGITRESGDNPAPHPYP